MGAQLTQRLSAPSLQKENGLEGNSKPEGKAGPSSVFASCSSDDAFKNTRGKRKNRGGGKGGCPVIPAKSSILPTVVRHSRT